MSRNIIVSILLVLIISSLFPGEGQAQWSKIGAPVCLLGGTQLRPKSASDGSGGAVIAFRSTVGISRYKIFAQKVNGGGEMLWPATGIAVGADTLSQFDHNIVSDGAGGCIIVWDQDTAGSDYHVYAQRIDESGTVLWGESGVRVCTSNTHQVNPEVVSDGAGGAFIVWTNSYMGSPTGQDIFAQRISAAGNRVWVDTGFAICNATDSQSFPVVAGDGAGGLLITWTDFRSAANYDVYAQYIDGNATVKWDANGKGIASTSEEEYEPDVIADGEGGAYIAWTISTATNGYDIQLSRIDSDGSIHYNWQTFGEFVTWVPGTQQWPRLLLSENGSVIVIWMDNNASISIYAQRMTHYGYPVWEDDGIPLITSNGIPSGFHAAPDGEGGAIVTFNLGSDYQAARALRVTGNGDLLWDSDGILLTEGMNYQGVWGLVPTDGGVIATFDAFGPIDHDCFAQRIDNNGRWGNPAPAPVQALDVPYDQGGNVLLTWVRSYLDAQPYYLISHYSVWRKMSEGALLSPGSGYETVGLADIGPDYDGKAVLIDGAGAAASAWEWIENVEAAMLPEYSCSVPTYYDSIDATDGMHEFAIAAHETTPVIFWMSGPIEGYSVDNLAPAVPAGIVGEQQEEPAGLLVSWTRNTESDLACYNIYRAFDEEFVPAGDNLILTSTGNSVFDTKWTNGDGAFYKVCAVDIHGNIGAPATLSPGSIILETQLQSFAAVYGAESIVVSWTLSISGEFMEFRVSRSVGNREFSLIEDAAIKSDGLAFAYVDNEIEAGKAYRYLVEVTDEEGTRVLFETGPVSTPARELALFQNFPNPFNPSTVISFNLPVRTDVAIDIFDIAGRKVRALDCGVLTAGLKSVRWNGVSDNGDKVSSGVYFYRLTAGKEQITRKMILMR
ncbi:MAG: T9SS type A sorting domain-containing protein [Candidatus Krumholzibacteriota bacterium]|nr:T9SS type A sorting domain-containing protein [Candidatus Krumholzibacteriota bacterium]